MSPALEARNLCRTFRVQRGLLHRENADVQAVRDLSFKVERGELFGLLGPNGAGKTTTIKMLNTLLLPTSGSAYVMGQDVTVNPRQVRRTIGYVFGGDRGLYDRLSALDNLRLFAELYSVDPRRQAARIGELLELVGLTERRRDRVEGFSRGMKQRLHIARGLLHDPDVILLDEPTIGIDPVGARELRATIAELARSGKTVLLTTHYMFEADELCRRVAIINHGQLVAHGTPEEIKRFSGQSTVLEVETFGCGEGGLSHIRRLPEVTMVTVEDRGERQILTVHASVGSDVTRDVVACLDGIKTGRLYTREPTLEDAYVQLVGVD